MKLSMKVVHQLNLKKKEKTGERGVTPANPHNVFWVLIPVYFTFRNAKIHETVGFCPKKTVCDIDKKPHFKTIYMYI